MMKNEIKIVFFDSPKGFSSMYIACAVAIEKFLSLSHCFTKQTGISNLLTEQELSIYKENFPDGYCVTFEGNIVHEFNPKNVERQEKIEALEILDEDLKLYLKEEGNGSDLIVIHDFQRKIMQEAVSFYLDKLRAEG